MKIEMTRQLVLDVSHWSGTVNWNKAKSAGATASINKKNN
jgi:hypothetical protein